MAGAVGVPEDRVVHSIGGESEPLRFYKSYADMVMAAGGVASPAAARSIRDHFVDLLALTLGASRDAAEIARQRGLRAGRLNEVLSAINAGYCDAGFSLQAVARKQRVSVRYLRNLLHESGKGFTERVLELRLQHAWRLLTCCRHGQRKVTDIALASGFGDISYFNLSFRTRFGMTPSDARAGAARGGTATLQ